jgi:hypothetical protein
MPQPEYLRGCFAAVIALFLAIEYVRHFKLPPVGSHLDSWMKQFLGMWKKVANLTSKTRKMLGRLS